MTTDLQWLLNPCSRLLEQDDDTCSIGDDRHLVHAIIAEKVVVTRIKFKVGLINGSENLIKNQILNRCVSTSQDSHKLGVMYRAVCALTGFGVSEGLL